MGYHYVYLLDAELPQANVDSWLGTELTSVESSRLEEDDVSDWDMSLSESCDDVREVFENLNEWAEMCHCELGAKTKVRAMADKSGDAWLSLRGDLVHAVMALAAHGGKAHFEITGFLDGPDDGFRVDVEPNKVTVAALDETGGASIKESERFQELLAMLEAAMGEQAE